MLNQFPVSTSQHNIQPHVMQNSTAPALQKLILFSSVINLEDVLVLMDMSPWKNSAERQ